MITRETICYSLISMLLLAASVEAQPQITPATPGDPSAKRSLVRLIKFPETDGDATVLLECQTIVKSNGRLQDANCFIKNNWEPEFAEAVRKAGKKAAFQPAKSGKNGQEIGLMFQVEFLKRDGEKTIKIYLNPGETEMVEEYGVDHISAQRVMGKERWESACPKHANWVILAKAHINEEGIPSSVDLTHAAGILPTGPCRQSIIDTITSSQFAPAFVDDVAVPSSYVEPFGN